MRYKKFLLCNFHKPLSISKGKLNLWKVLKNKNVVCFEILPNSQCFGILLWHWNLDNFLCSHTTVWKFEHFSTNLYVKSICCNFNSKYVHPNWFHEISVMLEKTSNFHTVIGQDEKRNIHPLHQVHRHLPQIQNRDGSS